MEKIIDAPETYTDDMLRGIYVVHPDMLKYVEDGFRCYCTAKKKQGEVAIITNKNIGYPPLFLGYAGENLLDGYRVDGMFQSPSSEQLHNVAKEVEARTKVLFLYENYIRDIIGFDMAAGMLDMDDTRMVNIVGADDMLSNRDIQIHQGAAGIFFMYKCIGAVAVQMGTLEETSDAAKRAKENTGTVEFVLTPCVIPEIGHSNFILAEDEMAFGTGIYGEPGVWSGPVKAANNLAKESVGGIPGDMLPNLGEEICLLINGLGTASQGELYILSGNMHRILKEKGTRVYRIFVGECTTSMEMTGASVSICHVADQEIKQWTDMPVHTPFYTQV